MIKVKWLKSHSAFAYFPGEVGHVSPLWAEKLLAGGFIILIPDAEKFIPAAAPSAPGKINSLPEDLPGRERLYDSGFDTLEKIKELDDDQLLDAGISNTILKKLKKYFKA